MPKKIAELPTKPSQGFLSLLIVKFPNGSGMELTIVGHPSASPKLLEYLCSLLKTFSGGTFELFLHCSFGTPRSWKPFVCINSWTPPSADAAGSSAAPPTTPPSAKPSPSSRSQPLENSST